MRLWPRNNLMLWVSFAVVAINIQGKLHPHATKRLSLRGEPKSGTTLVENRWVPWYREWNEPMIGRVNIMLNFLSHSQANTKHLSSVYAAVQAATNGSEYLEERRRIIYASTKPGERIEFTGNLINCRLIDFAHIPYSLHSNYTDNSQETPTSTWYQVWIVVGTYQQGG